MPSSIRARSGEEDNDDGLTLSQLLGRHPQAFSLEQGAPGRGGSVGLTATSERTKLWQP